MAKSILLSGPYSVVEPLGLMTLSKVALEEGWKPSIELIKDNDFGNLERLIAHINPDMLGCSVYTGNHVQTFNWLDNFRKQNPNVTTLVGGAHPTCYPKESVKHADYAVISEGFNAFRRILRGDAKKGIVSPEKLEEFPIPSRESFYQTHKSHTNSPIKSIVTTTGCPYRCGHCYNSVPVSHMKEELGEDYNNLEKVLGGANSRLFPKSLRDVKDIIKEVEELKKTSPNTKLIFDQSDVHGVNIEWMREFAEEFPRLGISYHALMRFEYVNPNNDSGKERIDLMKKAGCNGLTFAVESGIPIIRDEVLKRSMKNELMFEVFDYLSKYGFTVRTQQMLGLPYGATSEKTPINLEADLETLRFNIQLKEETGLPTMAWASIYTPYLGTATGDYCNEHGFYSGNNDDIHTDFFTRSILRFPKRWIGPSLKGQTDGAWMSVEEQEEYRGNLQMLRDLFTIYARFKDGDSLAKSLIERDNGDNPSKYASLSKEVRAHVYDHELYCVK